MMVEPPGRKKGEINYADDHTPAGLDPTDTSLSTLDHVIPIRLKAIRMSLGLSAAHMDRQAGFAPGTVGRLERGDLRIYANHLYRISQATGIALGYFYNQSAASENEGHSDRDTSGQELQKQRLLLAYMNIKDPAVRRDVFELVETLAAESNRNSR
ncbi:helix-turn-helix transcriptional regulator [Magnetovibrio sp.]|uniref:helix-turn-helix domain-containing protein n=1 Tax=Magnetovibrio sp. TaxID=2024836 RepID=UPI002F953B8F